MTYSFIANEALDTPDPDALIRDWLRPNAPIIDRQGAYPADFLRAFGAAGGYASAAPVEFGGSGAGLPATIDTMRKLGQVCGSTAFAHWCHSACMRYLALSDNEQAKKTWLPELARGSRLAGTGLSNIMKSACGIENFRLQAERVTGGYRINGVLPWVSNLGTDHVFVTAAQLQDDGRLVFILVRGDQPGFRLVDGAEFCALDGTGTYACHFRGVVVADAEILAHPEEAAAYLDRIKPGMMLAQMGMALGLIEDCVDLIRGCARNSDVNRFVALQAEEIGEAVTGLRERTLQLAAALEDTAAPEPLAALLTEILALRLAGSEWALRAADAAMQHAGARGYLRNAPQQRRLREAYFVAIVTPSLKHLRRELDRRAS